MEKNKRLRHLNNKTEGMENALGTYSQKLFPVQIH